MKRTPIRARSKKRAKVMRDQRIPLVIRLLEERPVCERCYSAKSVDCHELKSRARGGSITDPANIACLCRPCHDLVTAGRDPSFQRHSWENA